MENSFNLYRQFECVETKQRNWRNLRKQFSKVYPLILVKHVGVHHISEVTNFFILIFLLIYILCNVFRSCSFPYLYPYHFPNSLPVNFILITFVLLCIFLSFLLFFLSILPLLSNKEKKISKQ